MNIRESPENITFDYDRNLFRLNHTNIEQKSVGRHTLPDYLEITCISTFNQDKYIDVLADGNIVGKLKILKNGRVDRKRINVLVVPVKTKIVNTSTGEIGNVTGEGDKLRKYFGQALITPNARKLKTPIDISGDSTFRTRFVVGNKIQYTGKQLHNYMLANYDFKRSFPGYFIVYVFDVKAMSGTFAAAGEAYGINSDNVLIFEFASRKPTCLVHEILHASGLYHTFDNDSLFTFPKVTENIMDYTNPRYATFKWQWDIIRRNSLVIPE